MKLPTARTFELSRINKLWSLRNGCRLLGVFGSGRQGVNLLINKAANSLNFLDNGRAVIKRQGPGISPIYYELGNLNLATLATFKGK